ncbi:MAG: NAD(P)-binding domain-containing protein, partial [Pseudanabaena sp.]
TEIGTGAVSISSAAVELAQIKLQDLSDKHTTIIGAGKMSRLLVKHLISKGAQKIAIVNRSRARAEAMLKEFEASGAQFDIHPLEQMFDCVAVSDLVFTSTASTEVIISRKHLEEISPNHIG